MAKNLFNNGAGDSPKPELTHEDFSSHLLKNIADKEGTNIVAKPIDIMRIIPDVTQPRRAIPFSVRRSYENTAHNVPLMLEEWHLRAEQAYGYTIQVRELITGIEETDIEQDAPALLRDYLDLISLAASIHREGLTNAITVSDVGDMKRIETGERRYLAHHLLTMYVDNTKYTKVAAQTVTRDVWRQASENGARKPLNAIGLARQLALLIMDMYTGDKDVFFDSFEALILPGECDRKFYAQVANGNSYSIKRGMSQKILDVTGLKSRSQIGQYRNLLNLTNHRTINDILWTRADEENWTEGALREISYIKPVEEIEKLIKRKSTWTLDDLRELRKTLDMSTTVDITHENQPYQAPARPSILPDRPAPQSARDRVPPSPHRYDDDLTGYDDIEPDDDYDINPDVQQWQEHKPAPAPQPRIPAPSQRDPRISHPDDFFEHKLYAQRKTMEPIIKTIMHYASQLDGHHITINGEERMIDGSAAVKILEFYLTGNLHELMSAIKNNGSDALLEDIGYTFNVVLDVFEHLAAQTADFMQSVLNQAIEYHNQNDR